MIDEVNYGSLITTTKCYGCIHFPLCIEQNGRVNLGLASENDCTYFQSKLPNDAVVLTQEEWATVHEQFAQAMYQKEVHTRKETAEKFAERLKESKTIKRIVDDGWIVSYVELCNKIDEICEEITEGK